MIDSTNWSRRRFLGASAAAAVSPAGLVEPTRAQQGSAIPPPIVITGGVRPLLRTNTARPLRYQPSGSDFVVHNGSEFFNRPLYGPISDFRVDAGDRPEFSLYLPGHGGNLKVGFLSSIGGGWLADCQDVTATYRPGRMIYRIADRALGSGWLQLELLTAGTGNGLLLKVEAHDVPRLTTIVWAFGGASGRKGRRNGDIGCEVEPVSQFFQLRPDECAGNVYTLDSNNARLHSGFCDLLFSFPPGSHLGIEEFGSWQRFPAFFVKPNPKLPVLNGSIEIGKDPLYLAIQQVDADDPALRIDPAAAFEGRSRQVEHIAATVSLQTPDPFLDPLGPALSVVAEALWDPKQGCVMHGCVAWRSTLAGWRGSYALDATGAHERAKTHFRRWLAKQNVSPVTTGDPATGPADPNMHLARKERLLHSNGDLSGNHYDMNLVFFDVLLRHLRWTGDLEFAREIWPALQRHLAWERRLFRRTFTVDGTELPLYEAYAAIWASDNLQYNGGGAAHSSAYNVFSHRFAVQLARMLGEDPTPYRIEGDLIHEAMQRLLWIPSQGAFAESKDLMGPQTVYNNPALWTVYHTIDSEVTTPRQAWQMVAERLATLKRIPVHGDGVPVGDWYLLACSDWLPYMWSLTLIVLAENMHFALALWQAGMADEAYKLFKGNLLDSMYMGLCPGDFHMSSALDAHRQEAQRDFGDPTGIAARALVEGLFGFQPDMLNDIIVITPGFPSDWQHASLHHPDFDFAWRRDGLTDTISFGSRFPRKTRLYLRLRARTTTVPTVTGVGDPMAAVDETQVDAPAIMIKTGPIASTTLTIRWTGRAPSKSPAQRECPLGEALIPPPGVHASQLDDPQSCLANGKIVATGFHTVFARVREGDCEWDMPISFTVKAPAFPAVPKMLARQRAEPVDLTPVFTHSITEIFSRHYAEPRSNLCALSVPDTLLGGWANIDPAPRIDDQGLRGAGGMLATPLGFSFRTPAVSGPNCVLLSWFVPDKNSVTIPLTGRAAGICLLVTGTTLPQCSRTTHATATVAYTDSATATLPLRNPENWWPIEQDYLLDDYLFVNQAPLPPRVSLRTGETRLLDSATFKGQGRSVPGGGATIVHLALDPAKTLASLKFEVNLYGIVAALLGVTLIRA